MKKIISYMLLPLLALAFTACRDQEQPTASTMKGVFYASLDGADETVELLPNKSKTFTLLAKAEAVSDVYLTFSFKVATSSIDCMRSFFRVEFSFSRASILDVKEATLAS